jgi:hypothetical protein
MVLVKVVRDPVMFGATPELRPPAARPATSPGGMLVPIAPAAVVSAGRSSGGQTATVPTVSAGPIDFRLSGFPGTDFLRIDPLAIGPRVTAGPTTAVPADAFKAGPRGGGLMAVDPMDAALKGAALRGAVSKGGVRGLGGSLPSP